MVKRYKLIGILARNRFIGYLDMRDTGRLFTSKGIIIIKPQIHVLAPGWYVHLLPQFMNSVATRAYITEAYKVTYRTSPKLEQLETSGRCHNSESILYNNTTM